MGLCAILGALLGGAPGAAAASRLEEREVLRLLGEGDRALESARSLLQGDQREQARQRLLEAQKAFQTVLDDDATRREAATGLARVYYLTRRHDDAIALLAPFAERHPEDVDVAHQLGLNLYRNGRFDEAVPLLERAAEDPERFDAMWILAVHFYRNAAWSRGLPFLERYVRVRDGDPRALGLLGTYYLKLDRYDDAIAALDRFLVAFPDNVAAQINRANALFRGGHADKAAAAYETLLLEHPDRVRLAYNLAAIRIRQGRCQDALPLLDRFLERQPEQGTALYFRGDCLYQLARYDEAESAYRRVLEVTPSNPWAHHGLSRIAESRGRLDEALAHAARAVELVPSDWELATRYGTLLRRAGRPEEALAWHDKAAVLAPSEPRVQVERGRDLWALRRLQDARAAFDEALRLAPGDEEATQGLAAVLTAMAVAARRAGEVDGARGLLGQALAARPGDAAAAANLALLELGAGRTAAARAALDGAAGAEAADLDAVRAAVALAEGRTDAAAEAAARAKAGGAGLAGLLAQVEGQLAARRGEWRVAAEAFDAALAAGPSRPLRAARTLAWLEEGLARLGRGDAGGARAALRRAADDRELLDGADQLRLELADAASALLAKPSDKGPLQELEALVASGRVAQVAGREARDVGWLYIAWGRLQQGDTAGALKAVRSVPARGDLGDAAAALERLARDREARALYEAGRFDAAADAWEALARRGDDPALAHNAAVARFRDGKEDAARAVWTAQARDATPPEALFNLAVAVDRQGDYRRAWELFRDAGAAGGRAAARARERAEAKARVLGLEGGAP